LQFIIIRNFSRPQAAFFRAVSQSRYGLSAFGDGGPWQVSRHGLQRHVCKAIPRWAHFMTRRMIIILSLAGLLAACGARGALQPPPGAPKTQPDHDIVLDPLIKSK
jgi:predicted small lipoprotein YifL